MPDDEAPPKPKHKGGRPRINIDVVEMEKLAAMQCTDEEIAVFFGTTCERLNQRKRESKRYTIPADKDRPAFTGTFREILDRGRATGRMSVRREQFRLLQEGNATMGIWLGKQLLGQRDFDKERAILALENQSKKAIPEWFQETVATAQAQSQTLRLQAPEVTVTVNQEGQPEHPEATMKTPDQTLADGDIDLFLASEDSTAIFTINTKESRPQ